MTVAELIKILQTLPQDLQVSVNDEVNGIYHESIGTPFVVPYDEISGDSACVCFPVNEED